MKNVWKDFLRVEQELLILERDYNNMKDQLRHAAGQAVACAGNREYGKAAKERKVPILDPASFPRAPDHTEQAEGPGIRLLVRLCSRCRVVGHCVSDSPLSSVEQRMWKLVIGPQLLAAIPDFSFLWRPKGTPVFPGAYLPRRRLRSIAMRRLVDDIAVGPIELQKLWLMVGTDKRFVAKLFPRSMAAEQYRVAAAQAYN